MSICCDRLCVGSALKLALTHRESPCRYFSASRQGEALARLLARLGILRHEPQMAHLHSSELNGPDGGNLFLATLEDVRTACAAAERQEFAQDPFVAGFGRKRDLRDYLRFLKKALAESLWPSFFQVQAARLLDAGAQRPMFLARGVVGSRQIARYAAAHGIAAETYPASDLGQAALLDRSATAIAQKVRAFWSRLTAKNTAASPTAPDRKPAAQTPSAGLPVITTWYGGQNITFNDQTRTAFFWLLKCPVPKPQVLVYFSRRDVPLTAQGARRLAEEGVRSVALLRGADTSGSMPLHRPGPGYRSDYLAFLRDVGAAVLGCVARGRWPSPFYWLNAAQFGHHYSYWTEFYARHKVKISVSVGDFSKEYLAKNAALRDCGGVSVSYQFSNVWLPSVQMSSCSDVVFSFGPEYLPVWQDSESGPGFLVHTGYLSDYSFRPNAPAAQELRQRLLAAGARRVVCFFDENSSDDPMCLFSNERTRQIYRAFLEKVLREPGLGLICKPGYPRSLRKRLGAEISALIEETQATGRCVFIEDGDLVTDTYPTLAAQAADVSVGLLASGTAALESFLSGTPTVFLDLEKLYTNPVYLAGKDKIVFDSLGSLFQALDSFCRNPASVPGFGDLSDWVRRKDPFRDGKAAERAGQYIGWLYEAFAAGRDRDAALAFANERYRARWGQDSVTELRPAEAVR